MNYAGYIDEYVNTVRRNEPIYTDTVADRFSDAFGVGLDHARKAVNVHLKRLADKGVLVRMKKGMYGKTGKSVFGAVKPNATEMAFHMFMYDGEDVVGYEAGATLLNILGLSTLMPKDARIATNKYRYKIRGNAFVVPVKPIAPVTNENVRYLQLIEAVRAMKKYESDAENSRAVLLAFIKIHKLDMVSLLGYAYNHCNDHELREIVGLVTSGEETDESAS
jgi:hypothetical protein